MDFLSGPDIEKYLTQEYFSLAIRILFWVVIALPLVHITGKWVKRITQKKFSAQLSMIFHKIILYTGYIIISFSILNIFGFEISTLLGAAGIIGIAVGFASQTSVSNIISGWFLIAEKPFEVDDVITVGSTSGVVLSIDMLSIKLRTFNNEFVRIPNETIIKTEVINVTRFPIRRVDISVGVAYKENIDHVKEVLTNIAKENPLCLNEPEASIIFTGFGNSSLDFHFRVWAVKDDWLDLKNSIMEEIKKKFDEEKIEIPFPHLSLYSGSESKPIPVSIINPAESTK
ncbi:MAG: mechanosensitive ion channel family protein [Calditrichaeota bacterium]|nr:MAG: mechanosensitive ion channel family protein [Calditrichota bacterium]MBL1203925.1 mechanosensitive ion channel family protein [Calditrichota bacterium]NOG43758.1 mechanosensitive ion channel family protein [Calditrichota bacterium]